MENNRIKSLVTDFLSDDELTVENVDLSRYDLKLKSGFDRDDMLLLVNKAKVLGDDSEDIFYLMAKYFLIILEEI